MNITWLAGVEGVNISLFTEFKTGRIVPIEDRGRSDWAFVPNPLPARITMNDQLWLLLAEASGKVGQLDGLCTALPSPSLLLRPLQQREALTSNSLEGTYVTPKELLLFQAGRLEAKPAEASEKRADWGEVNNYERALQVGASKVADGWPLDRALLCDLHRILLSGVRGRDRAPGTIRDFQVFVGVEGRFIPPPVEEVEPALVNWEQYLAQGDDCHPIIRAYIAHYQFEAIHPFRDGNGRLGRLWLSLNLYKWLHHSQPWLYMSEFFEQHRRDYIDRLFRVSTNGEWSEWLEFCLLGTRAQAEASIARCQALSKLKADYMSRITGSRTGRIVEMLFDNPFIELKKIQTAFDVSQPTARSDVAELEKAGILVEMEKFRSPKVFVAMKVFSTAYQRE